MDLCYPRRPHPVRLHRTLRLHEVDVHRRLSCTRYLECLDQAARGQWLSFTCVRCFAFRPRFEERIDWPIEEALRYLAEGRGNRVFPSAEAWLACHVSPDRTQL